MYSLVMRPSSLRHTLAVLRQTIGLTQKEMAVLIGRSTRTIQAIELGTLPLSEELAYRIAEATGVEAGWLLDGDLTAPPRKGLTALGAGNGTGPYTRNEYEFHRAFLDSPTASPEQLQAIADDLAKKGGKFVTLELPVAKAAILLRQTKIMEAADKELLHLTSQLLQATLTKPTCHIIRWKIRRFLGELAREESIPWPEKEVAQKEPAQSSGKTPKAKPDKLGSVSKTD
jgi:transcriptional regulator with XRE-family HTH domain